MNTQLLIILVHQQNPAATLASLSAISAATAKTDFEILVACSSEQNVGAGAIHAVAPAAKIARARPNACILKTINDAVEQVPSDRILIIEAGILPQPGAIDRLITFAACMNDAGVWAPRIQHADQSPVPDAVRAHPSVWFGICRLVGFDRLFPASGLLNHDHYGNWDRKSVRKIDVVSRQALLINANLWQQLGGFDTSLRGQIADADLCRRAIDLDAQPYFTPTAVFTCTTKRLPTAPVPKDVTDNLAAHKKYMRKHWSAPARSAAIAAITASTHVANFAAWLTRCIAQRPGSTRRLRDRTDSI